jgi:predicted SprT family Zn-dependent metalloprotease
MNPQLVSEIFAWAPLVLFIVILSVVYYGKRNEPGVARTPGKTYACARCGRRGKHEHMVPVTREGAVVWYCGHCSQGA